MKQTAAAIVTLADCFTSPKMPRDVVIASLEALVRLALSEHTVGPILAMQADVERVGEILAESKKAA